MRFAGVERVGSATELIKTPTSMNKASLSSQTLSNETASSATERHSQLRDDLPEVFADGSTLPAYPMLRQLATTPAYFTLRDKQGATVAMWSGSRLNWSRAEINEGSAAATC